MSRIGNTVKITNVDFEEVENGDIGSSLEALVVRQDPSFPYVAVNIDNSHVRRRLLDLPDFDDPEYVRHWIDEQKEKLIPEGLNREEFISKYHLLDSEEGQKCLLVITKKQSVENRKELLESVGLKASIITTGQLQVGYGFIFDDNFVSEQARLISVFEDGASLQYYNKGILKNYVELTHSGVPTSDIIEEAKTYLLTAGKDFENVENQSIYLLESDYNDVKVESIVSDFPAGEVHLAKPLPNQSSNERFSADQSIAVGLAVKQLYPALDTINFVDNASRESVRNEIEKKDAVHTGILLGGLVVLAFLSLMAVQFFLNTNLEEARQEVALLQNDINTVNAATKKVRELKQQAGQAGELVSERTSLAATLELIGNSLPGRTWFNEVKINKSEDEKEVAIYGYAHNDALIASLMERLEKEPITENVRLIFSEAVNSSDVYNDAFLDDMPLVQFEIRITMNPETG